MKKEIKITKKTLQDTRISLESKGFLIYLLSNSPDFEINVPKLILSLNISRDRVYKILNELIEHGYVKRTKYKINNLLRYSYEFCGAEENIVE